MGSSLIRFSCILLAAGVVLGIQITPAFGEGTETLGPAGVALTPGSGFVSAGVGLHDTQPGTIEIFVPEDVEQVLLD